jgi:hypothetical protein
VLKLVLVVVCLLFAAEARPAPGAVLFRVFLLDGGTVVSYGEFARHEDRVIFSMPVGGSADQPRLHIVSLPASLIDWPRTERYAMSVRAQRYAETRGEEDFQTLSNDVARVLNDIALTTDRAKALELAEQARRTLNEWPKEHFGYRREEVREIVMLLDEAIGELRGVPVPLTFELALVAISSPSDTEQVLGMPTRRELLDQISRVLRVTPRGTDRIELLKAALALMNEVASADRVDLSGAKRAVEGELRREVETDERYLRLSRRLTAEAQRAAEHARVSDVQRVLDQVAIEDRKLGGRRPEFVESLRESLQKQLEAARHLRLLRDQWSMRRDALREYQRTIDEQMSQLTRARSTLEAVRALEGPPPETLMTLRTRLRGGAELLQRRRVPEELRAVHELLIGAWRFAESAVETRVLAVTSGNVGTAWEASTAAAGALLLMTRVQQEIRALLDPPTLP